MSGALGREVYALACSVAVPVGKRNCKAAVLTWMRREWHATACCVVSTTTRREVEGRREGEEVESRQGNMKT